MSSSEAFGPLGRESIYRLLLERWPPRDRETVRLLLRAVERGGALSEHETRWMLGALDLAELRLRDALVPRDDVVAVPADCSVREAARRMAESERKRLPVYRESMDDPVGVLHAVDVAKALADGTPDGDDQTAGRLARTALLLPETIPLRDALDLMRQLDVHLVLAVDEYDALAGLATLEDILEQQIGPIPDEYGHEGRHAVRPAGPGEAIVGASVSIHEVEQVLDVRLPKGRVASIGGLVYATLGRVPRPGDVVELPGVRITVLSMDGVRIRELRVTKPTDRPAPEPGGRAATAAPPLRLPVGSDVRCGHTVVGRLDHLVVNPVTGQVTHLVVRRDDRSVLVPVSAVEREEDEIVHLSPAACDLDRLPAFDPTGFVAAEPGGPLATGRGPGEILYALGGIGEGIQRLDRASHGLTAERNGQPAAELSRRTEVVTSDEQVGHVTQVLVDRASGTAIHVVVRYPVGLLSSRDVVVPLSWAASVTPERIVLAVRRDDLDQLPEYRPDEEIRDEVLARLHADARFRSVDFDTLHVEVAGGVVRLGGHVRRTDLKSAAERIAADAPGVLSVESLMVADDQLQAAIEQALRGDPGFATDGLDVTVLLGVVELSGTVATSTQREEAGRIVSRLPGVEGVVNRLEVRQSETENGQGGRSHERQEARS